MAETEPQEVLEYLTADGRCPFGEWINSLRDRSARVRIRVRLDRLTLGNFGDAKGLAGSLYELRIDHGKVIASTLAKLAIESSCCCAAEPRKPNRETYSRLRSIGTITGVERHE